MKILFILLILISLISCAKRESSLDGLLNNKSSTGVEQEKEVIENIDLSVPKEGVYGEGSRLIFQVKYDRLIYFFGNIQLKLFIGDQVVLIDTVSTNPSKVLEFEYIIKSDDHEKIIFLDNKLYTGNSIIETDDDLVSTSINKTNILLPISIDTIQEPPDKIVNISTAPSSIANELNVSWNVPNSSESIINYKIQYKEKSNDFWLDLESTVNSITIQNLNYNTDYEIRVSANNGVIGEYSDPKDVFIFDLLSLNPIAWLDASDPNADGILPENGSLIKRWVDKTGMATDAIEEDDNKSPVIEYNVLNGLPAIRFDSLPQGLEGGFVRLNNGGLTVFLVGKMDSVTPRRAFFEFYQEGSPTSGADSRRGFFFTYGFNEASVNYNLNDSQFNLWTAYDDGFYTSLWENGLNIYIDNSNHFGSTSFMGNGVYILGDDMTGGDAINGYICEFLIFDRELSTDDMNLIEDYLINKWGL